MESLIMGVKNTSFFLKNQRGLVILESVPLILVMFVLLGVTLGSWGIVHTAIMNSISSRHNAFFVINHRSELSYIRDLGKHYAFRSDPSIFYGELGKRFFFVQDEEFDSGSDDATATVRFINFIAQEETYSGQPGFIREPSEHRRIGSGISSIGQENRQKKVAKAWIMLGYGICLDANCGD